MKVAIIGAGPAGLAAVKHCLEEGVECVAYEQERLIGGTWNLVENTEENKTKHVHSSMYAGLRTNLPKQLMEFENYHYKTSEEHYLTQSEVLEYIHDFTKQFNLLPHIKLNHQVLLVDPLPNEKWTVKIRNLNNQEITENIFDGILVCNGHYTDPFFPSIPGTDQFEGNIIHSHRYRRPDEYKNKRILIIGGGFSGFDISRIVAQVADKVCLSVTDESKVSKVENVITKPVVSCFEDNRAIFSDGTEEKIDEVIFCTGYNHSFPFLSEKCQIIIDENWIKPLYKHLINIEHPSMAIINIPYIVSPFPLFSIQIRFYLALLKGHFQITKEEMYEDYNKLKDKKIEKGLPNKMIHYLGDQQMEYTEDLANIAKIRRIPRVIGRMFKYYLEQWNKRKCAFKILNDEDYEPIFI